MDICFVLIKITYWLTYNGGVMVVICNQFFDFSFFTLWLQVVEAVYENMKLKQDVFAKLDKICKQDTILCSNTSALSIDQVMKAKAVLVLL